ncbi:MAG TPA: phospholipase D-like domain-containing protein [Bdellovibrionota bacterium]|jgi:hypothetical protein|nr:phospholipase D-like domain-containing protein [Bdellovibrionota bacterium]
MKFLRRALASTLVLSLFSAATPSHAKTQIIVDESYTPTLLAALESARDGEVIKVLAFSFAIDSDGNINHRLLSTQVADKLIALKERGHDVQLYIEATRDTATRNEITAKFLEEKGITVKRGATHAKGVAIGNRVLLFGSTNLTQQSLKNNNETNVLTDEATPVEEFNRYFDHLWDGGEHGALRLREPMYADGEYKAQLLAAIRSATVSLDFSIYYFNDLEIENALIDAAKRGVAVRGYMNFDTKFATNLVAKNQETLARLKAGGLSQIYLDLDSSHSHSKYLIVNGKTVYLGTGNWNASDINTHPQLYIRLDDAHLATSLSAYLSQQIAYEHSGENLTRHSRIWIGARKPEIAPEDFESAISRIFVPATVSAIQQRGGEAYQPVLIHQGGSTLDRRRGALTLPDEVAHIAYLNPLVYRAAREAPVGQVYGPLHKDYFLMDPNHAMNSKSSVAEAWAGATQLGRSYEISKDGLNLQAEGGAVVLHLRKDDPDQSDTDYLAGLTQYFEKIKAGRGPANLEGYWVYVGPEYILEYLHFSEAPEAGLEGLAALKHKSGVLEAKIHQSEILRVVAPGSAAMSAEHGRSAVSVAFPTQPYKVRAIMKECQRMLNSTVAEHKGELEKIKGAMLKGKRLP